MSFVVINFNYGSFLGAVIESILRQEYTNYECVIIDNNSNDGSRKVLKEWEGRDDRLRFVYLDRNLNQLGALLYILDELRGDYLTIVDSDDLLFRNYASTHVRAHLAIPGGVAFTSSCVIEVDADGHSLTSGYDAFLRRNLGVPLGEIAGADCAPHEDEQRKGSLGHAVWVLSPEIQGWHWSPGTANMHRLALVRETRPRIRGDVYVGATDNYFMWLNHAIAGSARIDSPLSAYRHHGRNRYGAMVSVGGLECGTRAGVNRSMVRRRDITRELVSRPVEFERLAPGQFWRLMDAPAAALSRQTRGFFTNRHVLRLIEEHYDDLVSAFGAGEVRKQLIARMGLWSYLKFRHAARSRASRRSL